MKNTYWKGKRIFITGHEGFLGSCLTKTLLGYGAKIVGLDVIANRPISILNGMRKKIVCIKGNVSNLKLVRSIINEYKPQVVFHLAAEAIVGKANENPLPTFKSNIEGTWNILEAARNKRSIEAIITASSDKAYGSHKKLPYKEDTPLCGNHPYDVSKSCADLLASTYAYTYRVPVAITRCGNIYGPGDFNFSRIVPDAIRCALTGRTLLIRSDGKFTRDYVFVDDIVNGYILLAEKLAHLSLAGEAFNFSYEKPIPVIELVNKVYKAANKKLNYKILNAAKYEIKHQYLCSDKARAILKWKPRYGLLEKGLAKAIKWYKNCVIK